MPPTPDPQNDGDSVTRSGASRIVSAAVSWSAPAGIIEAFAFDEHFRQFGTVTVSP